MPPPPHLVPQSPATPAGGGGSAEPAAGAATFDRGSGRLPRLIVVLCFVITTLATALIYWRWANVTEPTSYVIVQGQKEHNGTVIVIRSDHQPEAMATLTPENQYTATIFLHPGPYTLTATLNGETLVHVNRVAAHRRWTTVLLRPRQGRGGDSAASAGVS